MSHQPDRTRAAAADEQTDYVVEFPPLRPKNLIRLGEDLLHASLIPISGDYYPHTEQDQYLSSISALTLRNRNSPTDLSPMEEAELEEALRKVHLPHWIFSRLTLLMVRPWLPYLTAAGNIPY